ncbi:hypothetical protein ACJQWK_10115 [Exserohilum turcicum]|uniref:Uncharacterized protein n=1 Tax=Exserohilum turcicum (strain 28A) TaxID=671987 RepID=R0K2Z5_EXST2|nr:uncharacterized protein SETTUDRAFT_31745 [Exserohilum turcica Et28A]EOA87493.1 hypothetical protein SETTUDRAFT_31745 [Exserohilum turcica Et28A]
MAPTPSTSDIPQAPPADLANISSHNDGFSPGAIIGIVIAIVCLLLVVPLIAVLLRRYEKSRLRETPRIPDNSDASLRSIGENHSLQRILVTKELLRSSIRMERIDSGLRRPDEVYGGGREREESWSHTDVQGGSWK